MNVHSKKIKDKVIARASYDEKAGEWVYALSDLDGNEYQNRAKFRTGQLVRDPTFDIINQQIDKNDAEASSPHIPELREQKANDKEPQITSEEEAATEARAHTEIEKKKPIKFKDAVGRKFSFPFHLCNTWHVRIQRSYIGLIKF